MQMPSLVFKDAEQARDSICIEDQRKIRDLYAEWADKVAERAEFYEKKTTASSYWQQQQMLELERQLRSQSMQIHKEIESGSKSSMYMIADSVVGCNAEFLKSLGFKEEGINAAFTSIPNRVVSNIVTGQIYEGGWSLSKAIWTDNQKTLSDIYSIVAQGRAMNMSAYEVSKMLEKYVSPSRNMQWNLKMNDGVKIYKKTVDYNAQRLVRTLNQHAYQQSVIQVVKDNPFIPGIYWRANGSRVCPLCMDRDGNFYKWNDLPMDHPNGMCTMEPATDMDKTIDQLADWIKEPDGTYPEIDEFAKKLGYEPLTQSELNPRQSFSSYTDNGIRKAYENVNPNYNPNSTKNYDEYQWNCNKCVVAFEANMRGGDYEALPYEFGKDSQFSNNPEKIFGLKKSDGWEVGFNSKKKTIEQINQTMEDYGIGSRAIVTFKFKGEKAGHTFNVIQTGKGTKYIDAQVGKELKPSTALNKADINTVTLYRVDNRPIDKDLAKQAIRHRK